MTEDEARQLATRIIDTWPNGAKAYIWRDLLHPLDAPTAYAAYRELRATYTTAPTPGALTNAYQAIRQRRPPDTPTPNRDPDEELIGPDHPRAQAAIARGITEGRRELAAIRARARQAAT